jgi:hypothetical protein
MHDDVRTLAGTLPPLGLGHPLLSCRQDASGNLQATGSLAPGSQPAAGLRQGEDMGASPLRRLASPHRRFFISSPVRGMVSPMRGMVQFTGAFLHSVNSA